jgi:hypothetical protein
MKYVKHGVSLVAVLVALVVAGFAGDFEVGSSSSDVSVVSTDNATYGDVEGARGLHW